MIAFPKIVCFVWIREMEFYKMGLKKTALPDGGVVLLLFSCFRCENKFVFAYCSGQWYNHRRNFEPVNDRLKGYARSRPHGKGRKRKREEHIDGSRRI